MVNHCLCKSLHFNISELYSNVKAIWIPAENVVYLYSEEEKARGFWVCSSFFMEKSRRKGCFTTYVEFFSGQIEFFFFGSGGFFSGQVGKKMDDIGGGNGNYSGRS